MDKFDKNNNKNNIVEGQMGIEDLKIKKNNMFDDEKNAEKQKVNVDALKSYMERKEKELKKDLNVVDSYFKDIEKTKNSAFDGEVEVIKPAKKKNKEKTTATIEVSSSGGVDSGDDDGLGKLFHTDLSVCLNESMLPYTEHVILDRALPRVEDGLKPVQRRILYTMIELGLEPDKPFRKSARIVGDCLGKYHPHGDSSVYDAMVRMAQPFLMRSCLVDGQGNYGSIDGDSAAASRYTEAKLTPIALELLKDIDKDTVNFTLNFDDTRKEPETLPGKFPNLLVNGANGIAVGLTTSIPTHNPAEVIDGVVAYIDNKNITLNEMMKIIKGPDFPTGAYCLVNEDLVNAYETGKGKVVMRARVNIEQNGDKKNIVITEVPYQVNKAKLLQDIAALREANKQGLLGNIADVVDESDRNGMRAVIKLKKDANAEKILAELYKKTQMQCNFNINMIAVCNGKPEQLGLLRIIGYFVDYQQGIVYKRSKFDLEQAQAKEHILRGLIVAIQNIDEVVRIIKKSKNTNEAKNKLMERFTLSEKQAQAILDMRLAKLTSLEIEKIETELKELEVLIKKLTAIIGSKKLQLEVVKKEILEIKSKFADERRTEILTDLEDISLSASSHEKEDSSDVVIAVSHSQMIKKIPYKNYSLAQKDFNEKLTENEIYSFLLKTQTNKKLCLFTNKGNCFRLNVKDIISAKWREKGVYLKHLLKGFLDDEKVLFVNDGEEQQGELVFVTKQGMIKKSPVNEYLVNKYSFQTCKLKEGDEIVSIFKEQEKSCVVIGTRKAMFIRFENEQVPSQGRISGGVKAIMLSGDDEVIFGGTGEGKELVFVSNLGFGKRIAPDEIDIISRGRKGVCLAKIPAREEVIFASFVNDEDLLVYAGENEMLCKQVSKIESDTRLSKHKSLIKIKKGNALSTVYLYRN